MAKDEPLESLELTALLPASPRTVYDAWMSSDSHTAFTGDEAVIDPRVGGQYVAGGDYIRGKTLVLDPPRLIIQTWRTSDFPEDSPDSRLEIGLEAVAEGTRLTLRQSGIPDGQAAMYTEGWQQYYFEPMQAYFAAKTIP